MQAFFGRHNPPDGFYSQERYSKEQLTAESATHFDHYTHCERILRSNPTPGVVARSVLCDEAVYLPAFPLSISTSTSGRESILSRNGYRPPPW
jgi:hypothetical protein